MELTFSRPIICRHFPDSLSSLHSNPSRLALWALCITAAVFSAISKADSIAVVTPQLRSPYAEIFYEIIDGIEDAVGRSVIRITLKKNGILARADVEARFPELAAIIALGPSAARSVSSLVGTVPVLVGAVPPTLASDSGNLPGIHLAPAPHRVIGEVIKLLPRVGVIHVVQMDPKLDELVADARAEAKRQGVDLQVHRVTDHKQAAQTYRDLMAQMSPRQDILWLIDDSAMDAEIVLPAILQDAWDNDLVVISNNLQHVSRGALLALYPDNRQLGAALGRLALRSQGGGEATGSLRPLATLRRALNLRTLRHLRIDVGPEDESGFDLVFPRR